ncbi:MAG TPA: DUF1611 domain-containing protein [Cyclobacteriaceae bacterium]|nr:DUF1611 domain-containing protein [Cyclobacteriaceae bacterium]HMV07301.1 DUF1611 domain-containing protein [Cyclobacteriaceae bacterium]HMV89247.1 DUF1611 domain-containing protein [Cyclobacteriaceae bacterium]HMW99344.1 DUF1611 domain-containing protein [Cyclobacteriaceae bacterium]HMX48867.1 DUF1611 domain-containing protein [Cyclobacteriaceae bacterium]
MKSKALVITGGYLDTNSAKTAHGLIRGTDRFEIVGIVDEKHAGKDAGEVLDGKNRSIPVYASISEASKKVKADYCVVGVATKGGVIPDSLRALLREALENNMGIVNGLHDHVSEHEDLAHLAKSKGLEIIDVRKPKKFKDLNFWNGKIKEVKCPKIAVLGTDCALGKRTTTRFLVEAMRKAGYKAEMIYTGQTGWMQGAKYGFIFDSTLNDFISGEMEHAIHTCYMEAKPDIIFIEGQSSLRNPSGPAGSEWIVSADATAVVLQHNPKRKQYKDLEYYPAYIAQPKEEIELIKIYGAPTVAITVNTSKQTPEEAKKIAAEYEKELGVPAVLPLEEGLDRLVPIFEKLIRESK